MSDDKRIRIFDTTLRDGEQSPGCSMNLTEKLTLARQLERLGVDVIEAGFPIASEGDFEAVRAIASELQTATVAAERSFSRAARKLRRTQPAVSQGIRRLEEAVVQLAPGDLVVLYTDGISEAANVDNDLFGEQRLIDLVAGLPPGLPASETADRILAGVRAHLDGVEAGDDMTLLVLRVRDDPALSSMPVAG